MEIPPRPDGDSKLDDAVEYYLTCAFINSAPYARLERGLTINTRKFGAIVIGEAKKEEERVPVSTQTETPPSASPEELPKEDEEEGVRI